MRTVVVCVLAMAFAAFAASTVTAAAADVEFVEAELVDADHPALMEVRLTGDGKTGKPKAAKGKGKVAVGVKGKGKGKSKRKAKPQGEGRKSKQKLYGNTGVAGGLPGSSPVPGRGRLGAKGGQKPGGLTGDAGVKGKQRVKGAFPKPGKESKTIGGHGTGAFGGQAADGFAPNNHEAVNKGATKGGPIGGAWSTLFGNRHKVKGKSAGAGAKGPLTGKPPIKYPVRTPNFGNTGIAGGLPGASPVPPMGGGNTGIVPPGIGGK